MKAESEIVARQYEAWVYPKPETDLEATVRDWRFDYSDPSLFRRKLWPRNVEPEQLEILVAGCGSNQAALYAFRNPDCHVVGIDISEPSLGHQKFLKQKHNLRNLDLYLMDLQHVGDLADDFDLIVSTGVLHHLADPDAGLRVLQRRMRPNGVMSLMLYGYYRRFGVYMMQEAFRLLGVGQDKQGLNLVKEIIANLPDWHHANSYIREAQDLQYDSGIVDTFLHPQDRAYSVAQVLTFAQANGLCFQSWMDNAYYSVDAVFPQGYPLIAIAKTLPREKQWQLVELVAQSIACHRFLLCHQGRPVGDYTLDFSSAGPEAEWLSYIPGIRHPVGCIRQANTSSGSPARLRRDIHEFEVSAAESQLLEAVDGKRSIRDILETQPLHAVSRSQRLELAKGFFARMADFDHLQFEIPRD